MRFKNSWWFTHTSTSVEFFLNAGWLAVMRWWHTCPGPNGKAFFGPLYPLVVGFGGGTSSPKLGWAALATQNQLLALMVPCCCYSSPGWQSPSQSSAWSQGACGMLGGGAALQPLVLLLPGWLAPVAAQGTIWRDDWVSGQEGRPREQSQVSCLPINSLIYPSPVCSPIGPGSLKPNSETSDDGT